jgi:hypothetical protein
MDIDNTTIVGSIFLMIIILFLINYTCDWKEKTTRCYRDDMTRYSLENFNDSNKTTTLLCSDASGNIYTINTDFFGSIYNNGGSIDRVFTNVIYLGGRVDSGCVIFPIGDKSSVNNQAIRMTNLDNTAGADIHLFNTKYTQGVTPTGAKSFIYSVELSALFNYGNNVRKVWDGTTYLNQDQLTIQQQLDAIWRRLDKINPPGSDSLLCGWNGGVRNNLQADGSVQSANSPYTNGSLYFNNYDVGGGMGAIGSINGYMGAGPKPTLRIGYGNRYRDLNLYDCNTGFASAC